MEEIHRVCKNDAEIFIGVPHEKSKWAWGDPTHCFSRDTEILTENGWFRFDQLPKKLKVATINTNTFELEYQNPSRYIKKRVENLYHIKNDRYVDLLVTDKHRILRRINSDYKRKRIKIKNRRINLGIIEKLTFTDVDKLSELKRIYVPLTCVWNGKDIKKIVLPKIKFNTSAKKIPPINMDLWLAFFGIWLAEGSVYGSKGAKVGTRYSITISQSEKNEKKKDKIEKLLKKIPFKFSRSINKFDITNKQLWSYLSQFGNSKTKFIPKEIKNLPPERLKILLDWMVMGDGHISERIHKFDGLNRISRGVSYSTSSKKLADDVTEILLKIGKISRITFEKGKEKVICGRKTKSKGIYVINIKSGNSKPKSYRKLKYSYVYPEEIKKVSYNDDSFCVSVPNETLYVRRNGLPCWSGNCKCFNELSFLFFCKGKLVNGSNYGIKTDFDIENITMSSELLMFVKLKVIKPIRWEKEKSMTNF